MRSSDVTTVIEQLLRSLSVAARFNPSDVVAPVAILWTDHDSQWLPIIPQLRQLAPQLLTLGEYQQLSQTYTILTGLTRPVRS